MIYCLISEKLKSKEINDRKCFIVYYEPNYYIISAGHNIEACNVNYLKINNKKIYLKENEKIIIPEIDLIIFPFDNDDKLPFFNIKNNNFNIDDVNDAYLFDENEIININNIYMIKDNYFNLCLPEMLMYKGFLNNYTNTKGLSGSPIFNNKNIIGIQYGQICNTTEIFIIPYFFVFRILNEIKNYNKFNGFCFFNINLVNNTISNNIEIDYNLFHKLNDYKVSNLQKGDIILSLDDIPIRDNFIFCPKLQIYININDYIIIHKTIEDTNNFKINRNSNKNKKLINVLTGNIDLKSCYLLDFYNFSLENLFEKGIYYKEINPELYRYLLFSGKEDKIDEKYFRNKPSNFKKRIFYSIDNDIYLIK
jgi:hypothetical protein